MSARTCLAAYQYVCFSLLWFPRACFLHPLRVPHSDLSQGFYSCVWPHLCFIFPLVLQGSWMFLCFPFCLSIHVSLFSSLFTLCIYISLASWLGLAFGLGTLTYSFRAHMHFVYCPFEFAIFWYILLFPLLWEVTSSSSYYACQTGRDSCHDWLIRSLRKQPTSRKVATWALEKRHLSNERRYSILMTCHYPDLGSASDWLKREGISFQPIRSTT